MHKTPSTRPGLRSAVAPLAVFFLLVLFDTIIGGALAALLQYDGFSALDQRINNVYQFGYGLVAAGAMLWLYQHSRSLVPVLACLMLFAGFVEDTMFYLLMPLCNPIIRALTGGAGYQIVAGAFMPPQVSGWTGWLGRMVTGQNIACPREGILALNVLAVAGAAYLLKGNAHKR